MRSILRSAVARVFAHLAQPAFAIQHVFLGQVIARKKQQIHYVYIPYFGFAHAKKTLIAKHRRLSVRNDVARFVL